jgi:hypothetical protein
MDSALVRQTELAIAAEAAAHAAATKTLNPFSEATVMEFGDGCLVYSGAVSEMHGAYALGLDGPLEKRDFEAIDRFFLELERPFAFWASPLTDPCTLTEMKKTAKEKRRVRMHGMPMESSSPFAEGSQGSSTPDHQAWTLAFSRMLRPEAKEPSLFALTKLHQPSTRFYLHEEQASYTFFHRGLAYIPYPAEGLSALQWQQAREFGAKAFVQAEKSRLPFLYERVLYEP